MTTSAELPAENPLVAQTERQAHASIAGYIYQIEQAILRWISLGADDALYLEGVEDCDLYSPQQSSAQLCQFKARVSSVSLGRAEIIETLNNFWVAVAANPAVRCELRYVTTSPVVVEQHPALDQEDFTARLSVASQPLLAWPWTLSKGQWLPRPEYDKLVSQITTQPQSTTLLLGEPGSGKSALLSRLRNQTTRITA